MFVKKKSFSLPPNKYFNKIICLDSVSSTQDYLKKIAQTGMRGIICVAHTQTNGHGRLGRSWFDDEENLKFSMLFDSTIFPCNLPLISLAAGVALKETIENLYSITVQIKWPNDILINGKKICGIISESASAGMTVKWVVCGVGVNLNMKKEKIPQNLDYIATSLLAETNKRIEESEFLKKFLELFCNYLTILENGRGDILIKKYQSFCDTIGKKIKVLLENETKVGIAKKIDEQGRLVVKTEIGEETFSSADIVHIR